MKKCKFIIAIIVALILGLSCERKERLIVEHPLVGMWEFHTVTVIREYDDYVVNEAVYPYEPGNDFIEFLNDETGFGYSADTINYKFTWRIHAEDELVLVMTGISSYSVLFKPYVVKGDTLNLTRSSSDGVWTLSRIYVCVKV